MEFSLCEGFLFIKMILLVIGIYSSISPYVIFKLYFLEISLFHLHFQIY